MNNSQPVDLPPDMQAALDKAIESMEMEAAIAFVAESNRIERIDRSPTLVEVEEFFRFMALTRVTLDDLLQFVHVYEPNAVLRNRPGMQVQVGNHKPPISGPDIEQILRRLLDVASGLRRSYNVHPGAVETRSYIVHVAYERLHPFTDCNGRSGRMLWRWMMGAACPLGFLHTWYYQSLEFTGSGLPGWCVRPETLLTAEDWNE